MLFIVVFKMLSCTHVHAYEGNLLNIHCLNAHLRSFLTNVKNLNSLPQKYLLSNQHVNLHLHMYLFCISHSPGVKENYSRKKNCLQTLGSHHGV